MVLRKIKHRTPEIKDSLSHRLTKKTMMVWLLLMVGEMGFQATCVGYARLAKAKSYIRYTELGEGLHLGNGVYLPRHQLDALKATLKGVDQALVDYRMQQMFLKYVGSWPGRAAVLKLAKKQFTALDWPVKLIIKIMVPLFMPRTSTGHPVTDLQEAFAFAVTLRTDDTEGPRAQLQGGPLGGTWKVIASLCAVVMVYAALGEKERAKQVLETLSTYAWKLVNSQEFDPEDPMHAAIQALYNANINFANQELVERVEKLKTSEANMGDLLEEVLAGMEGLSVEVEDSALESLTTALVKY